MTGEEDLAVRQARDGLALGRELLGDHPHTDPGDGRQECGTCGKWVWMVTHSCKGVPVTPAAKLRAAPLPCSWGDDAWHRAVSRLIRLHRPDYRRLLAQEQDRTEYTRAKMAAQEAGEQP